MTMQVRSLRSSSTMMGFRLGAVTFALLVSTVARAGPGNYNLQARLVGSDAVGNANQGWSVAISGDGNTALIGAPSDNNDYGAVFFFTSQNGAWTQQGPKLTGAGSFGWSVALSGDGSTAAVGAPACGGNVSVFRRVDDTWIRETTLRGTPTGDNSYCSDQGEGVALSGDGNTLFVTAGVDNLAPPDQATDCDDLPPGAPCGRDQGGAWVFVRSNGIWSEQAKFPYPYSGGGNPFTGNSRVSLSTDGNTLDAENLGVYARSGDTWSLQSDNLTGGTLTGTATPWRRVISSTIARTEYGGNLVRKHRL